MKTVILWAAAALAACSALACSHTIPQPNERLASTAAAIRSANELGAQSDPQAALHLRLAQDQEQAARQLMRKDDSDDNKRADLVLRRAKSDAELAIVLMRERAATAEAQKARQQVESAKAATPLTPGTPGTPVTTPATPVSPATPGTEK